MRERILKIASFLELDASELLEAADRERGVIEYAIKNATIPPEVVVVGGLMTSLARGVV